MENINVQSARSEAEKLRLGILRLFFSDEELEENIAE